MEKINIVFNLLRNYKTEVFQYLGIDFLLKFINIITTFFLVVFIDTVDISNNFVLIFVALYISVLVFSSVSVLFKTLTLYLLENKVLFDFRKIILTKFLNSRYNVNSNLSKGPYLSQRVINDTELINDLFVAPMAKSISSIFFLACLLPIFLQFNFLIILLLILSAVLPSLFFSFFNRKNRCFTSKYQEKFALYSSKLSDVIDSVREIKLFDLYKKETDEIDSKVEDLVLINVKRIFWGFTSGQFGVSLQHIIIGILLGFLGCQVQQKVITLGQAIFIYSISDNLFYVINDFWSLYFSIKNSDVPWKRIKRILLRKCENNDVNNDVKKINSIVFQNVSVEKNSRVILKNLNLKINSKDKTVLIGNTGVGKTTILNLIVLFDNISAGNILINGEDLYGIDIKNFRSKISYFTQDSFLFNTTIKENILLNLDHNNLIVNQKYLEILKICKLDNLDDKRVVGNKGVFVSGGEKQRITLARCLMKNPEVLLLDEFGNSIHENMEIEIYKNLINFYKDKIIIAVSHRVSIANLFDKKIQV
ncbi:ABC transporter [Endomicrobiia bacterium]|nr:ABC transporter [Endomicrobiia bacterium]GHT13706.1 ABC transporter [Endomicrobiia bacterium]GHT19076.1 ABC transporter [Endomicrobiia bacterium]GHT28484.1 ABC transporter [Endomicrobiia bacterium]